MNDMNTHNNEQNEAEPAKRPGFLRTHPGRWSSLVLIVVAVFMMHGVVFSTLDEVAPIDGALSSNERTLVIDPIPAPIRFMVDAR